MSKRFYKHKIENLININKIITIHYFHFQKDYKFEGETHDFWEIVYAIKSDVICYREKQKIVLSEGNLLFHKPKEFHAIYGNERTDSEVIVLTFECKSEAMHFFENKSFELSDKLKEYLFTVIFEAKRTFRLPDFNPELNRLELLSSPNLGGQQIIRLNLEQLLIYLMREVKEDSEEIFINRELISDELGKNIIEYLKENVYGRLSLYDICKKFYYGKTYICTEFKRLTGKTIFTYFNALKIAEAKRLIKKNIGLSKISDMLMFDSLSYFSGTFKKYTGITPKQYIASLKELQNT